MNRTQRRKLIRIIVTAILLVGLNLIPESIVPGGRITRFVLFACIYVIIGYDILRKAGLGIAHGQMLDENFLMAIATVGAFALALYEGSADCNEAIAVMLFYQIGALFESYAVGKSRRNIAELMDIRPDYANVEAPDGSLSRVDPTDVTIGDIIVVQPGEKVPIDGIVTSGESALDTSALTGESLPRSVQPGADVISGCINLSGVLHVRTTKAFGDSTVSKILELVEQSGTRKSRSEAFITRFARIYTPIVCGCAVALFLLPPLVSMLIGIDPTWNVWLYRALVFLVISCPCALVISIPLTFFAGIGKASREGILVKGSNYLEALAQTRTIAFDKTGTLTQGHFVVTDIVPTPNGGFSRERVLEAAALAESASSHPIAKSLIAAYEDATGTPIDRTRVADVSEMRGQGICAAIDGIAVAVGNAGLLEAAGVSIPAPIPAGISEHGSVGIGSTKGTAETCDPNATGTIVHVAIDGIYAGRIVISDTLKPNAAEAMRALSEAGVTKRVMLTGDNAPTAHAIATQLGITDVAAELLPEDKVARIEALIAGKAAGDHVAFVGDGINDAPVLSRADVGIAMGGMGSDAAIEAADVVLMDDNPAKTAVAVRIARKVLRIARQNITFALVIKFACLVLGALGIANMWWAIFADVGVMVLAVLNSLRMFR